MNTPTNFNQPPSSPNPNYDNPNNNSRRLSTIMGITIAALLGLCVFLLVSKYRTGQQLETTSVELNEQKTAFTDLDAKYNDAVSQLEQQKGVNAELDAKINSQIQELDAKKGEIAQLIREKRDYRSAMARFETQKNTFLAEIEQLKQQVGQLTEANTQLNTSLTETKTRLDEESTAKAALISEKTTLETEKTALSQKVDIASAVKVHGITVKPIDVRKSGKEREKTKASRVDKLSICFTTEANEVVPSGEETFQIRIIDPTGAPLAIESLGSGVAQEKKTGSEVRYTTVATTNYDNSEQQVCGAWQPGQNFVKGKYMIEVYNKGYRVGSSAFNLK